MLYLKASEHGIRDLYFQAQHGIRVLGRQFVIDEWLPNKNTELAKRKCRQYLESNIVCILVEFSDRFGIYLDLDEKMDILVSSYETVSFNFKENTPQTNGNARSHRGSQQQANGTRVKTGMVSLQEIPTRKTPLDRAKNIRPATPTTLPPRSKKNTRIPTNPPVRIEKKSFQINTFNDLDNLIEKLAANLDTQSEKQFRFLLSERLIFDRTLALQTLKKSFLEWVGPIADLIYEEVMEDLGKVETFDEFDRFFEILAIEIDEPTYQQKFRENISQELVFDPKLALNIVRKCLQESVGPIAKTIYEDVINELSI
ncbi:MAG: hypothetical protein ACFBSE_08030 [Prochloraceae cyanobacterium]